VNEVTAVLENAGAISYRDSTITVTNRNELERLACECYAIIAREYARLIDGRDLPSPLRDVSTSVDGKSILSPPKHTA
jgi:hypothetical protein